MCDGSCVGARLRIGELAGLAGVSTRTIRYYEELGLLDGPARLANGYRSYDGGALLAVAEIKRLQAVGLSLSDIAAARRAGMPRADEASRRVTRERLSALVEELELEQAALEARRTSLHALIDAFDRGDTILSSNDPPPLFAELRERLAAIGASERGIDEERRAWAAMTSISMPERWLRDGDEWFEGIRNWAHDYAGVAAAIDLFAQLRDAAVDDPAVEAAAARIIELIEALPESSKLAGEWRDDPAVVPVLRAIAPNFTLAQQRAMAKVLAHFSWEI